MNYNKQYENLIKKHGSLALPKDGYFERHHIVPKSMGGSDDISNLTYLNARCHLLAHWLLMNIHKNMQMRVAYATMCSRSGIRLTPKMYQIAREAVSGANSALAVRVHTPLGWFGSVREAARAHKTSSSVISKKAKSDKFFHKDYYYEAGQDKTVGSTQGKHLGKRVHTPLGWFDSVREAAIAEGCYHSTISKKCRNLVDGYFYEDSCTVEIGRAARKVHTPLGWFDSLNAAAKAHSFKSPAMVSSRVKNKVPEFYYSEEI